jgi:hypothetical protein
MRKRRKTRVRRTGVQQDYRAPTRTTLNPHTLQRALKTGHYTPETVTALQGIIGNQATIQRVPDTAPPEAATDAQSEAEKRLQAIMASLKTPKQADGKTDSDQYKKALESALKAFMATKTGKQIKDKALELALSDKGLPLTIMLGSGAIAALFATNAGVPGIPDIPIGENMSISLEVEGTMQNPTGIKFAFKYRFGGESKADEKPKSADIKELPPAALKSIKTLEKDLISKWIVARAYWEYEIAGPDEEAARKKAYDELKANSDGLPDVQLMAEALARLLMEKAGEKRIEFNLEQAEMWDSFSELKGLVEILDKIVIAVVPHLPADAQAVEQVTFQCGRKLIPIRVKKE